jgi:hypothetical protein
MTSVVARRRTISRYMAKAAVKSKKHAKSANGEKRQSSSQGVGPRGPAREM